MRERRGRRQPRFSSVKQVFFDILEHLNRMLGSPLVANFLLTNICPHRVITVPRGSPKVTLDLNPFSVCEQVENNTFLIPLIIRFT